MSSSSSSSWLPIPKRCHFSLANIPFGIISTPSDPTPRPAVAIGEHALDLAAFAAADGFAALPDIRPHLAVFAEPTLNAFAALGRPLHRAVRAYLQAIFAADTPHPDRLRDRPDLRAAALVPLADPRHPIRLHLPMAVGDYTDFYAGLHHAYHVGCLFRGPDQALQPNYLHLPVGYHGRASSVVVSGTPVIRPSGQRLLPGAPRPARPVFGPSAKLDLELELGCFLCHANPLGVPVSVDAAAAEAVFGYVLLNDWSARDVQAWEYVPLGPFTAKNFATTVSPWVVLADALAPFHRPSLSRADRTDVPLLPYLCGTEEPTLPDVALRVELTTASSSGGNDGGGTATSTSTSTTYLLTATTAAPNLLWSFPQMIAHHTVTGCNLRVGDLLGSGTISGPGPTARGSLLERNANGATRVRLPRVDGADGDGVAADDVLERTWLEDGDEVRITGVCAADADEYAWVGFGECVGKIEPAVSFDF